jgi:tRNA(fMet)-specific endonuclease VapC
VKLLDTDHWVAVLRGTLDLGGRVAPQEPLAITAVSVAELTHGAHRSARRERNLASLDVLLASLVVLDFDEAAGRRFGELKALLEGKGTVVGDLDLEIASIALVHDLALATHNAVHFERVPGLTLEDWLE